MLLVRRGTDPRQRKGDPVNAVAVIYVNQHLDSLRAEHQRNRMASGLARRSLRSRISAAAASLGIISSDAEPVLPRLSNYPYGG
jgi:hypothetical protein